MIVHGRACIGEDCTAINFGQLALRSAAPNILFDAGGTFSPDRDWVLQANDEFGGGEYFAIVDAIGTTVNPTVPFRVEGGAPNHALYVRSNGNVGLGTSTPGADLHVFGNATADAFVSAGPDPVSGPAFNFGYSGGSFGRGAGFLNVRPDANATAPNPSLRFLTANAQRMIITNTGDVGIGTASPAAALDVSRSTGALATLARFSNNKGIQVLYDRTDAGANDWQTSNFSGTFEISVPGSSTAQFSLNANGNLAISGVLTQGSSRDLKSDLRSPDPKEILTRVSSLPVSLWSYKDETAVRHVGPMAEDFHQVFGLGADDKHIAPSDQAGIALLAVQGLNQVVQEKDKEIMALRSDNRSLAERVAALEAMVSTLVNGTGRDAAGQSAER